ncbi:hypothetical protein ABE096_04365 [Robertmurraya massiliosenegalensis]|uniref:hypothetical protein n=1 Tax=Robertmurraya TaxID=2837507 RepID=UPI0039A4E065
MFDPTAFENMKVVLEGALYDRDLEGKIAILDRNDVMNLAKLSRQYDVTFSNRNSSSIQCTLVLKAALENLASELHPQLQNERLAGANIFVIFKMKHENNQEMHQELGKILTSIWGSERTFTQKISYDLFEDNNMITKEITLEFNRLIREEQIDDLLTMMDYMLESLQKINRLL